MAGFALGVLKMTLDLTDPEAEVRRQHADRLRGALTRSFAARPVADLAGADPGYLRFPAVLNSEAAPRAQAAEARRLGIMTGYPRALAECPALGSGAETPGSCFPAPGNLPLD